MDLSERFTNLLFFYPVFLFSLSCHEAAHGWMAEKFGDPTARYLGRVSLSPFPHIDLVGTVILPIFGILTGMPVIGWGKPVPVNSNNFKDWKRGTLWVSAFGPIVNIIVAILFALLAHILMWLILSGFIAKTSLVDGTFTLSAVKFGMGICQVGVMLNLFLAAFNLLPVPPLDGSGIVQGLLPYGLLRQYHEFSRYGSIVLILLFVTGGLRIILSPVYFLANLILP